MNLELERKKLDFKKVETAKMEMEFKILERMADIERIKEQIVLQESALENIKNSILSLEEK